MTRYDILHRFAEDNRTHRDHAFTFMVLTEMWVNNGQKEATELDLTELLRLLKTKRSTMFDWLRQLETFGYMDLHRGHNQHQKTTFRLYPSRTARTQIGQQPGLSSAEVGQHVPNPDSTYPNRTAEQAENVTQIGQHVPKSDGTYPNRTAESELSTSEMAIPSSRTGLATGNVDKSGSVQRVLVHNNNHLLNKIDVSIKDDDDVKGVQGKKQRSPKLAKCTFADSPVFDLAKFTENLQAEFPAADLKHYHARLLNWRDKAGTTPQRADWLSTAKTFLLNDQRDDKLFTNTTVKPPHNANRNNSRNSGPIIPATTDDQPRRFGGWQ